mmetsp:Transcript_97707/g.272888  ORF Transcript_97707/g.272888 Transcript_97707/m.272888 type:complete len:261 (+) Transcript_97707:618-1400(+)
MRSQEKQADHQQLHRAEVRDQDRRREQPPADGGQLQREVGAPFGLVHVPDRPHGGCLLGVGRGARCGGQWRQVVPCEYQCRAPLLERQACDVQQTAACVESVGGDPQEPQLQHQKHEAPPSPGCPVGREDLGGRPARVDLEERRLREPPQVEEPQQEHEDRDHAQDGALEQRPVLDVQETGLQERPLEPIAVRGILRRRLQEARDLRLAPDLAARRLAARLVVAVAAPGAALGALPRLAVPPASQEAGPPQRDGSGRAPR